MKRLLLFFTLYLSVVCVNAQNLHQIKGRTIDTASTSILSGSSISILRAKDSTLVTFTRSIANGNFEINNIKNGKYILLICYPKYADFVDHFTLDSTKETVDYGKINMSQKAKILADVIIKGQRAAMKIKGDTTEFDAAAYQIQPNSKVEDLIKQFPGIQVDKDGKITAQGQTVTKVLVDGEEFFGDDPTLVTKNLRADMVDKVQLFDKKSDQATFTGIDDGEKTKTLNIKLKEDKKNGIFGKVDAGIGTDGFYQGQGMFNAFKKKQKLAAYGIIGNTGTVGLGWEDNNKYGGSGGAQFTDDGGIYFNSGDDDFDSFSGKYNGEGIPLAKTAGVHYDNKWNKDKETLNTNYKIGSIRVQGNKNTLNQNNLSTGIINSNSDQNFDNDLFRQKFDATYEIKLDSTLTLKVGVDGTLKNSKSSNDYSTIGTRGDNSLLNTSNRKLNNKVDDQLFNINAFLTKKLKKKGRTISLNLNQSNTESKSNGFLNSENKFYSLTSTLDSTKNVDQNKINDISSKSFKSNLTYTEPITKSFSVIVNYGLSLINGNSDRKSYNKSVDGNYDILDTQFSNDYQLDQIINQGGAIFNYRKGKSTIDFGSKFSGVDFKQTDLYTNKAYSRNFINYNPQASFRYKFSQQKSFRITYNGNTNQPSLDQIQPIRSNLDQLNQTIGNPDLKPSFRSGFNTSFNSYKVLSGESIWINASYSFTSNPIISNVITSNGGQSIYQSTNLSGKMPSNFYLYGNYNRKIKGPDLDLGFNLNASGNESYNFINSVLNKTKNYNYSGGINLSKYKEKKYDLSGSFGPSYTTTIASVQQSINSNGWGWRGEASATAYLPWKIELSTDGQYQFTGKTQSFSENFERLIWNASISKKFFKAENLKLKFSGNDLLNQNIGFNRSAYNGNITQQRYTTIQRYFLGSIIWDFNKMGGIKKEK
ncbi:TonB-dependent receptor [Pedobacter changchengzhani]|uniref:TonB-dependent receptor n=1 Tax=Pedobacter changchengzhani TaxID=2529274 RepID=A0A4R5MQS0_9SPHI|nr:outer membrane beta-barrel family protein [Pedobacter changchengzhani]TDG37629.1 TonB-dependent receptor [Pedobacter changchengzhani]